MLLIYITSLVFRLSHADDYVKDFTNENWTSCDDFLMNTTFDVKSVVDIDWKIFYFWKRDEEKSYNIRFSLVNPILIDRFKVELKHIDTAVNWSKAVLFMETSIDFSAIYLTTNTSGKFILIPSFSFQMDKIPLLEFGLKVVKPGYLGIANCQYRFCYALAPVDKFPKEKDLVKAAETMGFKGDYNRSYMHHDHDDKPAPGDSDEDVQFELDKEALDLDD